MDEFIFLFISLTLNQFKLNFIVTLTILEKLIFYKIDYTALFHVVE